MRAGARGLVLGGALFPVCLVLHELGHLALLQGLGGNGALVVRPWRFEFLPISLPSLHVTGGPGLEPWRRILFDLGGPLSVAVLLGAVLARTRYVAFRAALLANIGILLFFGIIETADYLLDSQLGRNVPLLTWEEFNYGLPLLMLGAGAALAGRLPGASGPAFKRAG